MTDSSRLGAALVMITPLLLAPKGCDAIVGRDQDARGAKCGGLNGASCPVELFCSFSLDDICGFADAEGTCEPRPTDCNGAVMATVCGCDGYPYRTACEANAAGISVANEGPCDGSGGGSGQQCGGLDGAQCPTGEFCEFSVGDVCGFADAMGICTTIPSTCPTDDNPVCGCDGTTYENACGARRAAISVDHEGPCP
jgi:hypothetical protein